MQRSRRPALQRDSGKRFSAIECKRTLLSTGSTGSTPVIANTNDTAVNCGDSSEVTPSNKHPASDISGRRVFFQNWAREERTRSKIFEIKRDLELATVEATDGPRAQQLKESEEIVKIVSNLTETNRRNEGVIQRLERQLSDLKYENEVANEKARHWRKAHAKAERVHYERVEKMATTAIEQFRSQGTADEAWKSKYEEMGSVCDGLVEKIEGFASDNEALLARCQRLEEREMEHEKDLATMDDVREENDALHRSMEDAAALASGMKEEMMTLARTHQASVAGYEERLGNVNAELHRTASSNDELSAEVKTLTEENIVLRMTFKEAEDYWDRDTFMESNSEKEMKQEIQRLRAALGASMEARNRCEEELRAEKDLEEENDRLRAALEEAKVAENHHEEELVALDAQMEAAYQTCNYLLEKLGRTSEESKWGDDGEEGSERGIHLEELMSKPVRPKIRTERAAQSKLAPLVAPSINGDEKSNLQRPIATDASITLPQRDRRKHKGTSQDMAISSSKATKNVAPRILDGRYRH